MATPYRPARRTAEFLLQKYGRERFLVLLDRFRSGAHPTEIAKEFEVQRQIVWRWKRDLGAPAYVLHPEVEAVIHEQPRAMA